MVHGTIMNKWAQYLLKGLPGGDTGFTNVYAPNETGARTQLWGELLSSLPHSCRWLLLGDFNFVERRQDKTSTCGRFIPSTKRLVFDALKSHLVDEP